MFGRKHNRRRAEDRVDTRRKHPNLLVTVFYCEVDVCAFATANPIALTLQNFFGPAGFDLFYVGDELLGVVGDAQEPLIEIALFHCGATAPAHAARRLLV